MHALCVNNQNKSSIESGASGYVGRHVLLADDSLDKKPTKGQTAKPNLIEKMEERNYS